MPVYFVCLLIDICVCVIQNLDQGVCGAEKPFPGDPRRGEGDSGEDHRDFRLQVPAVPAQRDAGGPGQGLPGRRAQRDASMQTVTKTQLRVHK